MFDLIRSSYPDSLITRLYWFGKYLYWGKIARIRAAPVHDRPSADAETLWHDFLCHFYYFHSRFEVKNYLKAPIVRATMFSPTRNIQDIADFELRKLTKTVAHKYANLFNEDPEGIHGWLSNFSKIMERTLDFTEVKSRLSDCKSVVEFGPGLGIAGELLSDFFKCRAFYFDFPIMNAIRDEILREVINTDGVLRTTPKQFDDASDLELSLNNSGEYFFISTWGFTESPMELRRRFLNILINAEVIILVSNAKFGAVDNNKFLCNLSVALRDHNHATSKLDFLGGVPDFIKRHELHVFWKREGFH